MSGCQDAWFLVLSSPTVEFGLTGTKVSSPIWHLLLFSGRGGWWWVGRRCAKLGVMWFFPFYVHFLSDNKSLCAGRDLGNYSQEFLNPLLSP